MRGLMDWRGRTVRGWALLMIVVGFSILMLEGYLHYCHYVTPRSCPAESPWSFFAIALSNLLMLFGGLILQRQDITPALEAIEKLLPFIGNLIATIRPGGRRATDPPAVPAAPANAEVKASLDVIAAQQKNVQTGSRD